MVDLSVHTRNCSGGRCRPNFFACANGLIAHDFLYRTAPVIPSPFMAYRSKRGYLRDWLQGGNRSCEP